MSEDELTTAEYGGRSARDAYRLALSDALRAGGDPTLLREGACRLLAMYLRANRVIYARIADLDYVVEYAISRGVPPVPPGRHRHTDWGEHLHATLRAGRIYVVPDVASDAGLSPTIKESYAAVQVRSIAAVPLIKHGAWAGIVAVQFATPHAWTRDELDLLVESAERLWAAVERAEAELDLQRVAARNAYRVRLADALRGSDDPEELRATTLRLLGEQLRVQRAVYIEVRGDLYVIEHEWRDGLPSIAGPTPIAHFGEPTRPLAPLVIEDVDVDVPPDARATLREHGIRSLLAVPILHEGEWIAGIGLHAHTPRRWLPGDIALAVETAERLFVGVEHARAERHLRQVAQVSSFRLALSDVLRTTEEPAVIRDEACRLLGEHLGVNRVIYAEVCGSELVAEGGYVDGVRPLAGRFLLTRIQRGSNAAVARGEAFVLEDTVADTRITEEERQMWLAHGMHSGIRVGLVKNGAWVAAASVHVSRARSWASHEVELVHEWVDRVWTAIARVRVTEELREADRRKDEFIALLSHELRGPLTPLRAAVEILRIAGDQPTVVDDARAMMERQVAHMTRLVDDLLDAGRITRGVITLRRETVSLGDIITTGVEANRSALDAARLSLETRLPPAPCMLDVDRTRMVQVLSNLLHNASKFTPRGGRITVTASVQGDELTLVVADTGVGIAPELLPRVFELFVQGEPASSAQGGLGIGLSLAKSIVELHGGRIEARSAGRGSGTEIELSVPCVIDAPAPVATASQPASTGAPPTVVVIDDNVDGATALAYLVRVLGGVTHVAHSGEAGIAQVRAVKPDVVLLDIGMPNLDGYETCRRIRELVGSDVTILAVSGWGKDEDKVRAAEAGFDAHITKPPDPEVLRRFLRL